MEFIQIGEFEERIGTINRTIKKNAMQQTIEGFEKKGWALYEFPEAVSGLEDLKKMIETGYENIYLEQGKRYLPLPWVMGKEDNYKEVSKAICELKTPLGFVEFDESPSAREIFQHLTFPKVNAVYLIDSISFNGDLALVIDPRGMNNKAKARIPDQIENPAIVLSYNDIPSTLLFQVNQYRTRTKYGSHTVH